jgi:hypothetical protein
MKALGTVTFTFLTCVVISRPPNQSQTPCEQHDKCESGIESDSEEGDTS